MAGKTKRQEEGDVSTRTRAQKPRMFKVILHNDDFTPMEFVIDIVMSVFNKDKDEATHIMYTVHYKGAATCGIYPRSIAETKREKVMQSARLQGYPLLCSIEAE